MREVKEISEEAHRAEIAEQFSKQAAPFSAIPGHLSAMDTLVEMACAKGAASALDVACGPGLLACELARHAKSVAGLDVTEAMLAQARARQLSLGLSNIRWVEGDATALPFEDASFDCVITRYSLHHMLDPKQVLREMLRVCAPGGRVLVADVSLPASKAEAYDALELLRDPSHVHALTHEEFESLFSGFPVDGLRGASYSVELELEAQLKASFPLPGDDVKVRRMVEEDMGVDALGVNARREDGNLVYSCPIRVVSARRL